ncbi:hypothetical protein MBLNU459_g6969t1 [Dothideomycetes sp. NU459]
MSGVFDNDGDSQMMQSSGTLSPSATSDLFPDASKPSTPAAQTIPAYLSDLSPPDSQGVPVPASSTAAGSSGANMPAVAASVSGANANGKRPISSIDATGEGLAGASVSALALGPSAAAAAAASAGRAADAPQGAVKTHEPSGYTWVRAEDEPGYAWRNKKALDEYSRTWEAMVHKDRVVGKRYGDPFEVADHELAMMKSQGQPVPEAT